MVKRGGEVQILERGVLVARLVPVRADAQEKKSARRSRLIRSGVLHAGNGNIAELLEMPVREVRARLTEALLEDREDRV